MEPKTGELFSRNYLKPISLSADSERMRFRIATFLDEYFEDNQVSVGRLIEKEIGIKAVDDGTYNTYVSWKTFLGTVDVVDFLDILTIIARSYPKRSIKKDRMTVSYNVIDFIQKVFRDQNVAYSIDEKGGIHPFVDTAFTSQLSETIRNLSDAELSAARSLVEASERSLLASSFDGRTSVRSIFDAVENVFKLLNSGSNQMNKAAINDKLRPQLLSNLVNGSHEYRATSKLVDSLQDWVDAGHNYRHEPGEPEPSQPSMQFAVQYLSQGMGYVRWLCHVFVSGAHKK